MQEQQFEQVYSEVHGDKKIVMQRNKDYLSVGFVALCGGTYLKIDVYPSSEDCKPVGSYQVNFAASSNTYHLFRGGQRVAIAFLYQGLPTVNLPTASSNSSTNKYMAQRTLLQFLCAARNGCEGTRLQQNGWWPNVYLNLHICDRNALLFAGGTALYILLVVLFPSSYGLFSFVVFLLRLCCGGINRYLQRVAREDLFEWWSGSCRSPSWLRRTLPPESAE